MITSDLRLLQCEENDGVGVFGMVVGGGAPPGPTRDDGGAGGAQIRLLSARVIRARVVWQGLDTEVNTACSLCDKFVPMDSHRPGEKHIRKNVSI